MATSMPNDRVLPSEFYESQVLPAMLARLDAVFPEFGFKRKGKGWEATADPGIFGVRPDRIMCLQRYPYFISVVDGDGMTWTAYANGGAEPSGKRYVEIVRELAHLAGVDASVLDVRALTDEDKRKIEERRRELQEQAETRRREAAKQQAQDDAKAREAARNLIVQAVQHGDRSAAERYFARRGLDVADLPGGQLPASILYTPDVGFSREMIGAVVCVVVDEQMRPCMVQRLFCENNGTPIEVKINGNMARKATLGKADGGVCVLGEPKPGEPVVLCEGVETGVAIRKATGWCVFACISAGGLEQVSTVLVAAYAAMGGAGVIIAGDLDRSKRGQQAMVYAADRLRHELGLRVGEAIPSYELVPDLVGEDEMPIEGKSVDWEDVVKLHLGCVADAFIRAGSLATAQLRDPARFEEALPEEVLEPDLVDPVEEAAEEQQGQVDKRRYDPFGTGVYPKNQLKAAHEYLVENHLPDQEKRREGRGLGIVNFAGRLHLWDDGVWTEYDGKPVELIRARVQRHFLKHCKAMKTKQEPPRTFYIDADLSLNECQSVATAAIDEVAITLPTNDFGVQFWLTPNIDNDGEICSHGASWHRVIDQAPKHKLPDAKSVVPTIDGIIDLEAWRQRTELIVLPKTPLLFNLGRIEASIPVDEVHECLRTDDGLATLEQLAWSMCPEWRAFLNACFRHTDTQCAPAVIREFHKVIGNWIARSMQRQEANITWLVGPSGSGKSVSLHVVEALMGVTNTVSSTMDKLESQFHLKSWIGKALAIFADMEIGRQDKRKIVELLKLISTGDKVAIDRKYLDEIPAYRLDTRIVIATNNMPSIPDATQAIARRSIAFEFRHTVPLEERDPGLADRLTSPESLAGIFLLCLIGIKHIDQDNGFTQPKWYQGLIDDLKAQSSEYAEMIEDYIVVDADGTAMEKDLYTLYTKLSEINGQRHLPKRAAMMSQLKTCLTGYGWPRSEAEDDGMGEKLYRGIKISPKGMELITQASGSAAGGHDVFMPPS